MQKLSNGVNLLGGKVRLWVFKILPQIKMNLLKVSHQRIRPHKLLSGLSERGDYNWDVVAMSDSGGTPNIETSQQSLLSGFKKRGISDERKCWWTELTHCWQLFCWCSWCCCGWELVVTTLLWDPKSSVFNSDLISGNSVIASIFIVIWSSLLSVGHYSDMSQGRPLEREVFLLSSVVRLFPRWGGV